MKNYTITFDTMSVFGKAEKEIITVDANDEKEALNSAYKVFIRNNNNTILKTNIKENV